MEREVLIFLLQKHISGTLTDEDKIELSNFVARTQNKELLIDTLEIQLNQYTGSSPLDESRYNPLINGILQADNPVANSVDSTESFLAKPTGNKSKTASKVALTMILLLLLGGGAWYYFYSESLPPLKSEIASNELVDDALPGSNKAVLSLSDGSSFSLDSVSAGFIAQQGNVKISKSTSGELRYNPSSEMKQTVLFNTVTTPRGGQYLIQFSDGSRVKLNSFSSITFPVTFTGKERSVTITGEAYFEVVKNPNMPFKIKAYDMEVEVLGTECNINSYTDEPAMKTTLLKGSLRVSKNAANPHTLQPFQQGQFDSQGKFNLEQNIDPDEIIGWKNGLFDFNSTDLRIAMRQLSRWYDVEIIYEQGVPVDQQVSCQIQRSVRLSEAVKQLETVGIKCRIEGNKLYVIR